VSVGIGVNGINSVGIGAIERRGSPGVLYGNTPDQQVKRVASQTPKGASTDGNGDITYSGGLHLESKVPTKEPSFPGDAQIAAVKGNNIDTIV